jgi:hypothetical protein
MNTTTDLGLDDLQQRWLAQDRRLEQALRINRRLWLRAELARPRRALRWLRAGALANLALCAAFLLWNGSFLAAHIREPRFAVPAAALHLWLIAAFATTVARFARAGSIEYDAPVVEIQRRLAALRRLTVRSTLFLFLFGVPIWWVPFGIVALRSWLGVDLYRVVGTTALLESLAGSIVLAAGCMLLCRLLAPRAQTSPVLRRLIRDLAGRSLAAAENQLAEIAAFESDPE